MHSYKKYCQYRYSNVWLQVIFEYQFLFENLCVMACINVSHFSICIAVPWMYEKVVSIKLELVSQNKSNDIINIIHKLTLKIIDM